MEFNNNNNSKDWGLLTIVFMWLILSEIFPGINTRIDDLFPDRGSNSINSPTNNSFSMAMEVVDMEEVVEPEADNNRGYLFLLLL